jgi:hypothetical protein
MGSQGKETAGVVPLNLQSKNFKYLWLGICIPGLRIGWIGPRIHRIGAQEPALCRTEVARLEEIELRL